jgi:hypothetical protein
MRMEYGRKCKGDKGTNLYVINEDTLLSITNGRPTKKCVRHIRKHV